MLLVGTFVRLRDGVLRRALAWVEDYKVKKGRPWLGGSPNKGGWPGEYDGRRPILPYPRLEWIQVGHSLRSGSNIALFCNGQKHQPWQHRAVQKVKVWRSKLRGSRYRDGPTVMLAMQITAVLESLALSRITALEPSRMQ